MCTPARCALWREGRRRRGSPARPRPHAHAPRAPRPHAHAPTPARPRPHIPRTRAHPRAPHPRAPRVHTPRAHPGDPSRPCMPFTGKPPPSVAAFSVNGYNQLDDSVYYWCASGFGHAGRQGGRGSTDRGRAGPGGALRNHTRGRAVRGSKAEAKLPAGGVAPRPPPGARRRTARMLRRAGWAKRRPDGLVPSGLSAEGVYNSSCDARKVLLYIHFLRTFAECENIAHRASTTEERHHENGTVGREKKRGR